MCPLVATLGSLFLGVWVCPVWRGLPEEVGDMSEHEGERVSSWFSLSQAVWCFGIRRRIIEEYVSSEAE